MLYQNSNLIRLNRNIPRTFYLLCGIKPQLLLSFVTKVTKRTFGVTSTPLTADRFYSARLIGTQACIPITVTAIKVKQNFNALFTAYGHSLGYMSEVCVSSACSVQSNSIFYFYAEIYLNFLKTPVLLTTATSNVAQTIPATACTPLGRIFTADSTKPYIKPSKT